VIKGAAASFALLAMSGPAAMSALQQPRNTAWLPLAQVESTQPWFFPLTPRQAQVSELVAAGVSNKDIGKTLGIAESTTVNHVQSIFVKLDFHQRSQIVDWVATHRPPGDFRRTAVTLPSR
jgi:DNA-binding NarL/FixJ family response regulator